MRLVIDLQGAQTPSSRHRGIGRYSMALVRAMAQGCRGHEILIALNSQFSDSLVDIRAELADAVPPQNFRMWTPDAPVSFMDVSNNWRRRCSELAREAFLAALKPDVVHVSSLFEGLVDNAATSVGALANSFDTSVTLYDLIPLVHRRIYLGNPSVERWYENKLDHLRRASAWLSISESSRKEAIQLLGLPESSVFNVSTAADPHFRQIEVPPEAERRLRGLYGLDRQFVMYTGGIDHRKNIEGLIEAFAALPASLRRAHQLAIVCSIDDQSRQRLSSLASRLGLASGDLVLTGFVPEEDLLALYNLCKLFAFPSWHEGFGLPALEAMKCGAAVIAANTSSLPEVVGNEEALFDPFRQQSITAKLAHALSDGAFLTSLRTHARMQSRRFSWESCAARALDALEQVALERASAEKRSVPVRGRRPRLAYVSPLPPQQSGIADYSAQLLPELSRHYHIDVIVSQEEITSPWVHANCIVRSPSWFKDHGHSYDRIIYHFGNSTYHSYMFELLERHPGVVVLHDFFVGDVVAQMEATNVSRWGWVAELYQVLGYHAVRRRFTAERPHELTRLCPCNLSILNRAEGVIVHSAYPARLADKWYGQGYSDEWSIIPLMRIPPSRCNRMEARRAIGVDESDFLVCSFGLLGPHKLNLRLLDAWLRTPMARNPKCRLVFVGANDGGSYGEQLLVRIAQQGVKDRVSITGWVDEDTYKTYLQAADAAVQLRAGQLGETSAALLDCLAYGLPTIANAHGAIAEMPEDVMLRIPDEFDDETLVDALVQFSDAPDVMQQLSSRASGFIRKEHAPRTCADRYAASIETFCSRSHSEGRRGLADAIARVPDAPEEQVSWERLAQAIAKAACSERRQAQLLVDVTVLAQHDAKSGIQRVVRSILLEMLKNPPTGYRVEPVHAIPGGGYRYARQFTLRFLGCPGTALSDDPVGVAYGDVFLALDLQPEQYADQPAFYRTLKAYGVPVYFVVYDMLPLRMPQHFPAGVDAAFRNWLSVVLQSDGAICISRSVADELLEFVRGQQLSHDVPFKIGYFHLGSDLDASAPSSGLPEGFEEELAELTSCPSILMVGTIEPRKGHALALDAFDRLWRDGTDVNLIIVGKEGWGSSRLVQRLRTHPEAGKRLRWYEGLSDEALGSLYRACSGLLFASEGEGFGLPLVEAARHGKPALVRDLPVFREVAGKHARYFDGTPQNLADALASWLSELDAGTAPSTSDMRTLNWNQSARQLVEVLRGRWYTTYRGEVGTAATSENGDAMACVAAEDIKQATQ